MTAPIDTTASKISYLPIGAGITRIDTGFFREAMAACYLVEGVDSTHAGSEPSVAIIETGIGSTVPLLLALLAERGISRAQVRYVIPTHVHLDHAGGVGGLMAALPNATLVIHPMGARHMIDPAKLQAGAIAVYGEAVFNATYGVLIPVPEQRVQLAPDGFTLTLGNRMLTFYDTPGHARHHFSVHDSESQGIFTGDTCGIAYPELDTPMGPFLFPTTTPVQFDPQAMKDSINRLFGLAPQYFFLTHYGPVKVTDALKQRMFTQIDAFVAIAQKANTGQPTGQDAVARRHSQMSQTLMHYLIDLYRSMGGQWDDVSVQGVLAADVDLNVQGLGVWLDKQTAH